MPKLVDMKRSKKDQKEEAAIMSDVESDDYSWSLRNSLSDEEVKKLGGVDQFEVGQKVMLIAEVEITEIGKDTRKGGKTRESLGYIMKKMSLTADSGMKAEDWIAESLGEKKG